MKDTVFYLGGGADGQTYWRWYETSEDIGHDLCQLCRIDAVGYYSCALIAKDIKLVENKVEAERDISFAYTEYCKAYTPDIDEFCDVVRGILSIFSKSYIGRNTFARMSAEAIDIRHKHALKFLDEWKARYVSADDTGVAKVVRGILSIFSIFSKSYIGRNTFAMRYVSADDTGVAKKEEAARRGRSKNTRTFRDLINSSKIDPDELCQKMHKFIDDKKGKYVGLVLLRVYAIEEYLIEKPGRGEFQSEFPMNGSWSGIQKYMDADNDYYKMLARKIEI